MFWLISYNLFNVPVRLIKILIPFSGSLFFNESIPLVSQGADVTDPGTETEESLGATDSTQRPADSQTPSCKIQEFLSNTPYMRRSNSYTHKPSRHFLT